MEQAESSRAKTQAQGWAGLQTPLSGTYPAGPQLRWGFPQITARPMSSIPARRMRGWVPQ